jgi:hypothetical protein
LKVQENDYHSDDSEDSPLEITQPNEEAPVKFLDDGGVS